MASTGTLAARTVGAIHESPFRAKHEHEVEQAALKPQEEKEKFRGGEEASIAFI
ncbi:hypothetical protein [Gordonibacter sp.]|uniref:hypothetical protein n=1 Tax=Gordonibacter sp. TaxID=1968902 RepID=UPI0025BCC037|nr:hypothetical protein [Gordonibacter sp.]